MSPRSPASTEERTLRALREAQIITGPQLDAALAALTATEPCPRCGGDGIAEGEQTPMCPRCDGTGQQYVIR